MQVDPWAFYLYDDFEIYFDQFVQLHNYYYYYFKYRPYEKYKFL